MNNNSYDNRSRNSHQGGPQRGQNSDRPLRPALSSVLDGTMDYDPVEEGKKFADKTVSISFTMSQLRKVLSGAAIVKNRIDRENADSDTLSSELQAEISYLKIKLIYQLGRDRNLKAAFNGDNGLDLPAVIGNIGVSRSKFNCFYRLLESIVAFRKFSGKD